MEGHMEKTPNKILIIVENLPVPFDKRVWKESQALLQNGYDVTVLCPKGKGYERGFEVLDGIRIYRHPMPKEGNSATGYLQEYSHVLFWEFLYTFWIYLRRGFDVIQGCNPPDFIFLVALPFKLLGIKYIFDHHDVSPELYLSKYDKKGFLYWIQVWLEKLTFYTSDVVISTNATYRNVALSRGGRKPEDVFIVRNGPNLDTFKGVPPNQDLKHGNRYLVGYVGTMSIQDGLDILLDVASHLRRIGRDDVHFTCVGGGPDLQRLRQKVREMGLDNAVNFTGRIPDGQLLEILSTADVCVNPDTPCEMNNMSTMIKIMEYMALGKPIVQFDLKEGRISASEASLYADSRCPVEDFAAKILWLLDNPEARKRMGEFGCKRVEEDLAWEYSVNSLLAAYARALVKGRRIGQVFATRAAKGTENIILSRPFTKARKLSNLGANRLLLEHFRCPERYLDFGLEGELRPEAGFFKFGPRVTCYGRSSRSVVQAVNRGGLPDLEPFSRVVGKQCLLAFSPEEIVTNLRQECYMSPGRVGPWQQRLLSLRHEAYYLVRPFLGVTVRKYLQRLSLRGWEKFVFPSWPVDTTVELLFEKLMLLAMKSGGVDEIPFIWFWPDGASSCVVMTHDVETKAGAEWCSELMDIDDSFGVKSSFQIIPEDRYPVSQSFLDSIRHRGFETNVQDLNHDGRLYGNRKTFLTRAKAINRHAAAYGARGFRSAVLYRNSGWYDALDVSYDLSIPNVAHLEPQRGGCCTVFPYPIGKMLEIPLTTTQDYSLFHILNDYSIDLWKRQIETIHQRNGLVSFIVHPDYISQKRPRHTYLALLEHLARLRRESPLWFALPGEVHDWWRARAQMQLVLRDGRWVVEGMGSDRARIAFARHEGGQLTYAVPSDVSEPYITQDA